VALGSIQNLEHGLAGALEQALGRLGNATALQGRTAGAADGHKNSLNAAKFSEPWIIEVGAANVN
jgi:hypothetical protein